METWVANVIREIQSCNDLLALKSILVKVKEKLEFTYVLYAIRLPSTFTNISNFIISDYAQDWITEYTKRRYSEIDPVVIHCANFHEAFCWDSFTDSEDEVIHEFGERAASFGLVGGVSIGIHGHNGDKGIFSLASNYKIEVDSEEYIKASIYLTTFLPYFHTAITRLSVYKKTEIHKAELTTRELDCLLWSAEGKTAGEIAQILSIKKTTVVFHLKNVISKLNVTNRNQAIAKAILFGFIAPQHSTLAISTTYHF